MSATTPTVSKVQLGRLLAELRDRAGLTQDESARLIRRKDRNKIVLVERAQRSITPAELDLLLDGYGVDDDELRALLHQLRDRSSQRGRWTGYRAVHNEDFRKYIDFETDADLLRIAEVEVIPGLLQTEAYLRAMFAGRSDQGGPTTDELIQTRLARQAIIDKDNTPPELRFILSESCLRRRWGDNAVMREQIEHLITRSEMPNVIIQILPFELPESQPQIAITYRFTVLRIPAPGLAGPLAVVYSELVTDLRFDDDKKTVAAHDAFWTRLADSALSAAESRTFLHAVAETYR